MKSKALSCRQLQKKWLGEVKCTLMMYICSIISLFLLSERWFLDLIQFKPLNAITGLCYRLHNVITFKTSQLISIIKSLVIIISRLFLSLLISLKVITFSDFYCSLYILTCRHSQLRCNIVRAPIRFFLNEFVAKIRSSKLKLKYHLISN